MTNRVLGPYDRNEWNFMLSLKKSIETLNMKTKLPIHRKLLRNEKKIYADMILGR